MRAVSSGRATEKRVSKVDRRWGVISTLRAFMLESVRRSRIDYTSLVQGELQAVGDPGPYLFLCIYLVPAAIFSFHLLDRQIVAFDLEVSA